MYYSSKKTKQTNLSKEWHGLPVFKAARCRRNYNKVVTFTQKTKITITDQVAQREACPLD
jgi:hypothetical protein